LLQPASGSIDNDGLITTEGDDADAIHALAANLPVTNSGDLSTAGRDAYGISVIGLQTNVENTGNVSTTGFGAFALNISGNGTIITNDGSTGPAKIETTGQEAVAVVVLGDDANVTNTGEVSTSGIDAYGMAIGGQRATVNLGDGTHAGSVATTQRGAHGIFIDGTLAEITLDGGATGAGITTEGEDADGIFIRGGQATVTIKEHAGVTVEGDNAWAVRILGDTSELNKVDNAGILTAGVEGPGGISPTIDAGGIQLTGRGDILNQADAELNVFGESAIGILNTTADGSVIRNLGSIKVDSSISTAPGQGMVAIGDGVRLQNGDRLPSSAPDEARLEIIGDNSVGMFTAGIGAIVSNSTDLVLNGDDNRGIDVEIGDNGSYWVDNDGLITLGSGARNTGISVHHTSLTDDIALSPASNGKAFCVGGPSGAQVLNCGDIALGSSVSGVGMSVFGTAESSVDNQASITGSGDQQAGIILAGVLGPQTAEAQLNLVSNFKTIDLQGEEVTGISIAGSGNFVFNGTGLSRFEYVDAARIGEDIPTLGDATVEQAFITQQARGTGHGSQQESQSVTSLGLIRVDGPNAIGISVDGIGNLIGNRLDLVDNDGTIIDPNLKPEQQPGIAGFSEIIATGDGAIGVRMSGYGNVLDNWGVIEGEAYSVLGGSGNDIVQNKNRLVGNVDLAGNDDTFIQLGSSDNIDGIVDGGEGGGRDALLFISSAAPLALETSGAAEEPKLDGNKFRNFETLRIADIDLSTDPPLYPPDGRAYLVNDLILDAADDDQISEAEIVKTALYLKNGARLEADEIRVRFGAALRGVGSVGRRVVQTGEIASTIRVDPGGLVGPGTSPGTLEVFGTLELAGTLEIEIGGTGEEQIDVLDVLGDLELLETASFDIIFTNGFAPTTGDVFDFLLTDNLLGDLNLVNAQIFGLLPGFEFDLSLTQGSVNLLALTDGQVVPLPPAAWFFASALMLLGLARRKKNGTGFIYQK